MFGAGNRAWDARTIFSDDPLSPGDVPPRKCGQQNSRCAALHRNVNQHTDESAENHPGKAISRKSTSRSPRSPARGRQARPSAKVAEPLLRPGHATYATTARADPVRRRQGRWRRAGARLAAPPLAKLCHACQATSPSSARPQAPVALI